MAACPAPVPRARRGSSIPLPAVCLAPCAAGEAGWILAFDRMSAF